MTSRPPRILHVVSSIDSRSGGPAMALIGLAAAQKRGGIDVSVVATIIAGESDEPARKLITQDIPVEMIGPCSMPLRRHPQIIPVLSRAMENADVVHIHALYEEVQHQAARIAREQRKPYIFRACGMLTPWSLAQSRLRKKLYMIWRLRGDLNCAAALNYTTQMEADASSAVGLRAPTIIEPNGVDLHEFESLPPRGTFRARYPRLAGKRIVTFLGRIHPGKGLELLVPAFAKADVVDAMLVIVGPNSENYQPTIESLIRQHGIEDRVIFAGMLKGADRIAALADADLFALPSFHENFGIAVIEALAAGIPVIISDEVGVCREIESAQVGTVVPTQIDPLAAELRRWLSDEPLRQSAAARARPFVKQNYDWIRIAERWRSHYSSLT